MKIYTAVKNHSLQVWQFDIEKCVVVKWLKDSRDDKNRDLQDFTTISITGRV